MITNDGDKNDEQLMVEIFMSKMRSDDQAIPVRPTVPDLKVQKLRAALMLEETLETIRIGLGLEVRVNFIKPLRIEGETLLEGCDLLEDRVTFEFNPVREPNLIEIADGCADVLVVTIGTASACGIALHPIFKAVMGNNLLKFAPGHRFREDGKLIKPEKHPAITGKIRDLLKVQSNEEVVDVVAK